MLNSSQTAMAFIYMCREPDKDGNVKNRKLGFMGIILELKSQKTIWDVSYLCPKLFFAPISPSSPPFFSAWPFRSQFSFVPQSSVVSVRPEGEKDIIINIHER